MFKKKKTYFKYACDYYSQVIYIKRKKKQTIITLFLLLSLKKFILFLNNMTKNKKIKK